MTMRRDQCLKAIARHVGDADIVLPVYSTAFDWIDIRQVRDLIQRRFRREHSRTLSRRTHRRVTGNVYAEDVMTHVNGRTVIQKARRRAAKLGEFFHKGRLRNTRVPNAK